MNGKEKIMYGNSNTKAAAIGDAVTNGIRRVGLFFGSKMLESNGSKLNEVLDLVGIKVDSEKTGKAVAFGATLLQLGTESGSGSDLVLGMVGDLAAISAGRESALNEKAAILLAEEEKKKLTDNQASV